MTHAFNCRYLELCNACTFRLVYIVLNARDGIESEYPSIVFLSIVPHNTIKLSFLTIDLKSFTYKIKKRICSLNLT